MKGPYLLMEGSPIQDFQAIQPVAKWDCRVVKGRGDLAPVKRTPYSDLKSY